MHNQNNGTGAQLFQFLLEKKEKFSEYLNLTKQQNELLCNDDIDENRLEASIYQRSLLVKVINDINSAIQEHFGPLTDDSTPPDCQKVREETQKIMLEIKSLDEKNIQIITNVREQSLKNFKKLTAEHNSVRGYNNAMLSGEPSFFDKEM